jgi:hypothetical protein
MTALIAVSVIILLQVLLLIVFQFLQGSPDDLGTDAPMATVHVEERLEVSEQADAPAEKPPVTERAARQDLPESATVPGMATQETEAELVQLLDRIETEPKKAVEENESVGRMDISSSLLGKPAEKAAVREKTLARRTIEAPVPRAKRLIQIVSAEQKRFPASEQTDEMRILDISLAALPGVDEAISGGDVTLKVTFYDEIGDTGMAVPSRVQTSLNPIRLKDRPWKNNAKYLVTATYLVPKGYRMDYRRKTGTKLKYYGYIIELYYDDVLQDVQARPKNLVNMPQSR